MRTNSRLGWDVEYEQRRNCQEFKEIIFKYPAFSYKLERPAKKIRSFYFWQFRA